METRHTLITAAIALGIVFVASCTGQVDSTAIVVEAPVLLAVTTQSVAVGDDIEIVGGNFINGSAGRTEIDLVGDYVTKSGASHPVQMRIRPHWIDGNRIVWAYFGPFDIPFSPSGDELGTFIGQMIAVNVDTASGAEVASEPLDVELDVEPSVIITEFQPAGAECANRSNVILGGYEYIIKAKAVGFEAVNFSYVIAGEPTATGPRIYRQQAIGNAGTFGEQGEFFFAPVPTALPFYLATLGVAALDSNNRQHFLALDFGVHNPIEYVQDNVARIAEIMEAQPVSGCISGGETNGRTVTYTESETDTRSRSVGVNWNQEWYAEHSVTNTNSSTDTNETAVTVNESSTDGTEWGWLDGREISGGGNAGGSLFGIVEVGVSGEYKDIHNEHQSWNRSTTRGTTVGTTYSRSETESWAFGSVAGHSVSAGGSDFWTVESSQSTIVSFEGFILPGEYGVFYRQTTRIAIPGRIVHYNLCGEPEVVGETNFYDYIWSVDLAQGNECPDFPKTSLPEAECLIAPCEG